MSTPHELVRGMAAHAVDSTTEGIRSDLRNIAGSLERLAEMDDDRAISVAEDVARLAVRLHDDCIRVRVQRDALNYLDALAAHTTD